MTKYDVVIFDMDGTLVDSKVDLTASVNFVRNKKGLPPLTAVEVVEAINGSVGELSKKFYNTKTYYKEDREIFEEHYFTQCIKNIKVYGGIFEVLDVLKKNNYKLAIATNAPTKFAEKMIKSTNLYDYFDHIKGYDGDIPPKPSPHILFYLMEKFSSGKKVNTSIFIGDNESDLLAAEAAGISSIIALWGFGFKDTYGKICNKAYNPEDIIKYIINS